MCGRMKHALKYACARLVCNHRLCRYFRGKHPVEEILWRERVKRTDLDELCESFKPILVRCMHEWNDATST